MTTRQPSPQPSPQSSPQRSARQASLAPLTVLLAAPRGFCAGVERAVAIVEETLKKHGEPVYVRHEIVHNAFVVETLQRQGVVFVEELEDIPHHHRTTRPVVFSAHGVSKAVVSEAQAHNMHAIDATCPLVSKVHRELERFHKDGYHTLLIGHRNHPEVAGTMGQVDHKENALPPVTLIETIEDAKTFCPDHRPLKTLITRHFRGWGHLRHRQPGHFLGASSHGHFEDDRFLGERDRLNDERSRLFEGCEAFLHKHLRRGRGGGQPERAYRAVDGGYFALVLDEHGVRREALRDFQEAHRVRRVARADDEHQVASRRDRLHGVLAVGGGVADVVFFRASDVRKASPQRFGDVFRVVQRERRLGGERERTVIGAEGFCVFDRFDQRDGGEGVFFVVDLSHRACDFGMVAVSDEQGVVSVLVETLQLAMHFGDQRAGGIDGMHVVCLRLAHDGFRDSVRRSF